MAASPKADWHYALGAAMLAALAGAVIGLLLGGLLLFVGWGHSIALPVASGAIAGALAGLVLPEGAMDFVEGTVHFLVGFFAVGFSVAADSDFSGFPEGNPENPKWLRLAVMFGAAFAVALWVLSNLL